VRICLSLLRSVGPDYEMLSKNNVHNKFISMLLASFHDQASGNRDSLFVQICDALRVGDFVKLRPELRYDHAPDAEAYDNPTQTARAGRDSQVMFCSGRDFPFLSNCHGPPGPAAQPRWTALPHVRRSIPEA
jgi:hypothetical protein